MGFYFFGIASFLLAIGVAAFGVFFHNIGPRVRFYIICFSAFMSVPGFLVIWDYFLYRVIWMFPWS